jgi:hypothetical protein
MEFSHGQTGANIADIGLMEKDKDLESTLGMKENWSRKVGGKTIYTWVNLNKNIWIIKLAQE